MTRNQLKGQNYLDQIIFIMIKEFIFARLKLIKPTKKNLMNSTVSLVQEKLITKNDFPSFSSGDTITVYYEIREGDKVRTQSFKGVVIQIKGRGESKTFTIRKMSGTVGVERIFPLNMPL